MAYGYIQAVICNPLAKGGTVRVRISGATSDCAIFEPLTLEPKSQPLYVDGAGMVPEFVVERGYVYDLYFFDQLGAPVGDTLSVTVNDDVVGVQGPQGPQGEKGDKGDKGDSIVGPKGADGIDGTDGADGNDGVSLVQIRVDENSPTGKILYNLSSDPENWIDAGDLVPGGLGQVKNNASDSLGFLPDKIVAGDGISISLDETNRIKFDANSMDDHKVQAHMYSTEANYAGTVIQAGAGIDISLTPDLNRLVIKATGTAVGGFYWKGAWDELTSYNSNNAVWYFDNTVTPVVNRLYIAMECNQGINPIEDTSGIWSEMMRVDTLGDMFVAVDEDDVQTGYLIDKIRNGAGVVVTRHTDIGGNAYLAINSTCLYSVTIGGVTKYSPELGGGINFSAGGGSVVAWDGNNVKISSVALGETSTTAYRGDRGKTAYDHSQTLGNPHGTDFSELENKPTTLNGYGITDAVKLGETASTAYRGDRGKIAYDHSQVMGNPHGTDFSELENKPTTLNGYGITDGAERYHAFFDPSFFGEGTTSLYGHVRKAQYMTIDGTDVVPSSLMYQNVVQRFHMASVGAGTAGWLKVCSLTCVGGYTNEPITITLSRRGANKTCRLTIRFQSTEALNPYIELAEYEGQNYGAYYHKRVEGTYDIYVQKSEPHDRCHITEFKSPYNIKLNSENGTVATPPEGSISFKQAPSDYSKTGRLTSQDWNSFTEVGIYNVAGWSGANGPTINGVQAYKWGFLVVEAFQNTVIQTYYPHQGGMPCYRQLWEGGSFIGWSTSPRIGAGLNPNTAFVYQSISASRTDSNAIYLCY